MPELYFTFIASILVLSLSHNKLQTQTQKINFYNEYINIYMPQSRDLLTVPKYRQYDVPNTQYTKTNFQN